jgi:hypothetical protein
MQYSDLPVEFTDIRDDTTVKRGGDFERWKKYTFYLGKFGPFVERVPADPWDASEITRRVENLRQDLIRQHT